MNNDFEKTIELVDNIDKLLQQYLDETVQEEEKQWTVACKTKKALKEKREHILQAKKDQLKLIKFSLDKLTARHQEEIEKETYLKVG